VSSDEVRNLAELKKYLDDRIGQLRRELSMLEGSSHAVSDMLSKMSFRTAEQVASPLQQREPAMPPVRTMAPTPQVSRPTPTAPSSSMEKEFPLKTKTGEPIGRFLVGDGLIRIIPAQHLNLSQRTPPFRAFFTERILKKMQDRDKELEAQGIVNPEETMGYSIKLDGDAIVEIIVTNIKDDARIREIKNAVTWTFEKMIEKTVEETG
jgi:hypothetical protein